MKQNKWVKVSFAIGILWAVLEFILKLETIGFIENRWIALSMIVCLGIGLIKPTRTTIKEQILDLTAIRTREKCPICNEQLEMIVSNGAYVYFCEQDGKIQPWKGKK